MIANSNIRKADKIFISLLFNDYILRKISATPGCGCINESVMFGSHAAKIISHTPSKQRGGFVQFSVPCNFG